MKRTGSKFAFAFAIAVLLAGSGCDMLLWDETEEGKQARGTDQAGLSGEESPAELSAWIADWQWQSGLEDLKPITEGLTSLQLFAAYFNDKDSLYFTEQFREALPEVKTLYEQKGTGTVYLTIANDLLMPDGSSVLKDPDLISRLLRTEESRNKHMDDIIEAAEKYGVGGVELDYERIKEEDWSHMLIFCSELHARLEAQGKSLRVVLEPGAPIEAFDLPAGPEYVMMAYNLYGYHSGPGPKADLGFIAELADKMANIPGEAYIAFSIGGFDWREDGQITALTGNQAVLTARETGSVSRRDASSGSLYFDYVDADKMKHTVWFADEETLSQWIAAAREAGYNKAAVWRLGEMQPSMLTALRKIKE